MTAKDFLELGEAAKLLEVHPSTLRRWADIGKIHHVRTLSGRRRFTRAAILHTREEMQRAPEQVEGGQFELKTLSLARQRSAAIPSQEASWMAQLNEDQRLLFR
jgi:excisionase family DNA binding protein